MNNEPVSLRVNSVRNRSQRSPLIECLESRLMLSGTLGASLPAAVALGSGAVAVQQPLVAGTNYDLVPLLATLRPSFKGAFVTNTSITGKVSLQIQNIGTDPSPKGVAVILLLRPPGGTGSTDINITSQPGTVSGIANGKSKPANLKLTIPAVLPSGAALASGTYSLVVKIVGGNAGADVVQVVPLLTITLSPGALNLGATLGSANLPTTLTSGAKYNGGKVSLNINNTGNIPTAGNLPVNVTVVLHRTGGTDIPLVTLTNVSLKALKADINNVAGHDALNVTIPSLTGAQTSGIPAGTYTVVITVTPVGSTTPIPLAGVAPTITVTGGTVTGSTIFKHGDTITFDSNSQLTGTNFLEFGNFTTNTGANGSYQFFPTGLFLNYSTGDSDAVSISFIGAQQFFDPTIDGVGSKVIFSFNPTGAFATFPTVGNNSQTAYATRG